MNKNKIAFTLAEVLVVLGIIGVVAALTIPTLVKNYEKKITITKLKKIYSTINQALQLSVAENGEYSGWDDPEIIGDNAFFEKYLYQYLKNTQLCKNFNMCPYEKRGSSYSAFYKLNGSESGVTAIYSGRSTILFPDGSIIIFFLNFNNDYNQRNSWIYIDINGVRPPNTYGKDVFLFQRNQNGNLIPFCHDYTDNQLRSDCSKTGAGQCCAARIMRDGWQIKDDYPW